MKDYEGWNIVELILPGFGRLSLAFKGNRFRARKCDDNLAIVPIDKSFAEEREKAGPEANVTTRIEAEVDFVVRPGA